MLFAWHIRLHGSKERELGAVIVLDNCIVKLVGSMNKLVFPVGFGSLGDELATGPKSSETTQMLYGQQTMLRTGH